MARLHRFLKLNDGLDSHFMTFLVPPTLINDSPKEIESKEFVCSNQKWSIFIAKHDRHVGVYLCLSGAAEGLSTTVDFSFTFNNREHFTSNETFTERGCVFTHQRARHGRKNFISMSELATRNYAMANGQFLLALEIRKTTNVFEQVSERSA